MTDNRILTLRLPAALVDRVDKVARASDRSRNSVARRALEAYCETEEETLDKIREGLAALDSGQSVSHERVGRWLADLAKGKVRPHPRPRR